MHTGQNVTEGYIARPPSGTGPGIVVVHAWWGLAGQIKSVADRFAAAGFVALAPDLYNGRTTADRAEARQLLSELDMPAAVDRIGAAAEELAGLDGCTGRIGAIGFRMGGGLALWSAGRSELIRTAVAFYPTFAEDSIRPHWSGFAGKSAAIHCDEGGGGSAAAEIQSVRQGIEAAGGTATLHDYPGTRQPFFNDDRPATYDVDAAALSWARTLELFRTTLA